MQGRSYIQAIEAYASLNKLKSKSSTQIMEYINGDAILHYIITIYSLEYILGQNGSCIFLVIMAEPN